MKIELTPQESETHFYNSLCNGLGYMTGYGIDLTCKSSEYKSASIKLKESTSDMVCYEDILMEILRSGGTLTFVDNEDRDEEGNTSPIASITLADVHTRVSNTPIRHLMDAINENDDADTADVIIQTVFFNEIVYG